MKHLKLVTILLCLPMINTFAIYDRGHSTNKEPKKKERIKFDSKHEDRIKTKASARKRDKIKDSDYIKSKRAEHMRNDNFDPTK